VFINGQTAEFTMDSGKITKWREEESLFGPMVVAMKESIWTIKKKEKALSSGLMVVNMKVIGKMENNMVLAFTLQLQERPKRVSGAREKEPLG